MHDVLALATDRGVVVCERNAGGWQVALQAERSRQVTAIAGDTSFVLAGTIDGIFCSTDGGASWRDSSAGLAVSHTRWLSQHPDQPDLVLAGTEPAAVFVSHDAGGSWRECAEVTALRSRHRWWLPYSPAAGCVRSFALHGSRVYAAVEVGGVLRSDDWGAEWRLAEGSTGEPTFDDPPETNIHADVHSVVTYPSSPDLVFAATAEGLYRSDDGGVRWSHLRGGCYTRAVWVDPADSDHLILGTAESVARKYGRIEESCDGGRSWRLRSTGLEVPWPEQMVERFVDLGDQLLAIRSDGVLLAARLDTLEWRHELAGTGRVNAAAVLGQR